MMLKMTEEQWNAVVDIHLKGLPLHPGCSASYDRKEQREIINVTSVAGWWGPWDRSITVRQGG